MLSGFSAFLSYPMIKCDHELPARIAVNIIYTPSKATLAGFFKYLLLKA